MERVAPLLEGVLAVLKRAVSGFSPVQLLGVFVICSGSGSALHREAGVGHYLGCPSLHVGLLYLRSR